MDYSSWLSSLHPQARAAAEYTAASYMHVSRRGRQRSDAWGYWLVIVMDGERPESERFESFADLADRRREFEGKEDIFCFQFIGAPLAIIGAHPQRYIRDPRGCRIPLFVEQLELEDTSGYTGTDDIDAEAPSGAENRIVALLTGSSGGYDIASSPTEYAEFDDVEVEDNEIEEV